MFEDVHLMWKTLALVFCIKIPYTKSCYAYIHTHIKVIKFKVIFIIILVSIHMAAEKFKSIFCLLKYVIITENINVGWKSTGQ